MPKKERSLWHQLKSMASGKKPTPLAVAPESKNALPPNQFTDVELDFTLFRDDNVPVKVWLGKAQAIDDAVYDLKAVNPREKKVSDARTPAELLTAIEEKGREVDAALAKLKGLLSAA